MPGRHAEVIQSPLFQKKQQQQQNSTLFKVGAFFFKKKALWGEQLYGSFPVCDIERSRNQLKPCENGL